MCQRPQRNCYVLKTQHLFSLVCNSGIRTHIFNDRNLWTACAKIEGQFDRCQNVWCRIVLLAIPSFLFVQFECVLNVKVRAQKLSGAKCRSHPCIPKRRTTKQLMPAVMDGLRGVAEVKRGNQKAKACCSPVYVDRIDRFHATEIFGTF